MKYQFPVYQTKDFFVMVSRFDGPCVIQTIMTYITEEEEKQLDNKKIIEIERGSRLFQIAPRDVYCYGEIDYHNGTEDYNELAKLKFLNHLSLCGIWIKADYDYEHHVCYSSIKKPTWYDTTRPEVLSQYTHGILGKPKRSIIFSHKFITNGHKRIRSI